MATSTTVILDRAEKTLLDETNVQWSRAELLDYLNAVIRYILLLFPDAYKINTALLLTNNESKQTLPAGATKLLAVYRNMGAAGSTVGEVVQKIEMNHLDRTDLNWHTTAGASVKHYAHDPNDETTFWVYPKVATSWYLQVLYCAIPDDRDEGANTAILLGDEYETAIYYGILAFAYAKNAKRGDVAKKTDYMTEFFQALGINEQAQARLTPMPVESNTNRG